MVIRDDSGARGYSCGTLIPVVPMVVPIIQNQSALIVLAAADGLDNVATNLDAQVITDGSGNGRVGDTQNITTSVERRSELPTASERPSWSSCS